MQISALSFFLVIGFSASVWGMSKSPESCAENQYFEYNDQACGSQEVAGECKARPAFCTQDFTPVCGCDGKTYSNACNAHAKGASVAAAGECPAE